MNLGQVAFSFLHLDGFNNSVTVQGKVFLVFSTSVIENCSLPIQSMRIVAS